MPIVWWSSHPIAARYTSSELKAAAQTLREKNPFPMEMIKSLSVSESATRSNPFIFDHRDKSIEDAQENQSKQADRTQAAQCSYLREQTRR
jgi:hypothetical protein